MFDVYQRGNDDVFLAGVKSCQDAVNVLNNRNIVPRQTENEFAIFRDGSFAKDNDAKTFIDYNFKTKKWQIL